MFILFVSLYLFSLYEPFLLSSDLLMCTGDSKPWNRGERAKPLHSQICKVHHGHVLHYSTCCFVISASLSNTWKKHTH